MIVARAGETDFCAQFIVNWITMLAMPSPTAAKNQTHENAGTASPATGIAARRIEAIAWQGASEASRAVLLGSVPASSSAQLWSWSLDVGDSYAAEPDPQGWHEMIVVSQGRLRIDKADGVVVLGAGEFAIYSSAQQLSYSNAGAAAVQFTRAVVA